MAYPYAYLIYIIVCILTGVFSSLEENEIRKLIAEKRENLQQFFEDTKFYKVGDGIAITYRKEVKSE